jgi:hypothetical protein
VVIAMKKKSTTAYADDTLRRMLTPTAADLKAERELGGTEAVHYLLKMRRLFRLISEKLPVRSPRGPGRPKGMSKRTRKLLPLLEARVATGERPTTAARDLVQKAGVKYGPKARADHLVEVLKSRKKMSN